MIDDRAPYDDALDDADLVRRLKAQLRSARIRQKERRRVATLEWFRHLPFGGMDVTGR